MVTGMLVLVFATITFFLSFLIGSTKDFDRGKVAAYVTRSPGVLCCTACIYRRECISFIIYAGESREAPPHAHAQRDEGNQVRAANLLGTNRNTLRKKIRELGIWDG